MNRKTLMATGLAISLALAGCGRDEDDFRSGVPSSETVKLAVPENGSNTQGLSSMQQGLEGDTAGMYVITRVTTLTVNVGTAAVLGLIKGITEHRPTTVGADVAVWGPHTEALSPNTYRLTVKRVADGAYQYSLDGRAKTEDDSKFRVLISGNHTVAKDAQGNALENYGSGNFILNWNNARTLPEHGPAVGVATFTYSRMSPTSKATVDVDFQGVSGSQGLSDGRYHYDQTPGQGGSFEFKSIGNIHKDPIRTAAENLTIKSRWQSTGAGRSDVKVTGGDVTGQQTLSECWDANFASRFFVLSDPLLTYGVEANACVWASAEYSTL